MSTEKRSTFSSELDDYLQCFSQKKGEKILCGDFNIHVEEDHNLDKESLYSTTSTYGFHQVVNQPTHQAGGTLDLVFVQSESKLYPSVIDTLYLHDLLFSVTSDHKFIEFLVPFEKEVECKKINFSYCDFKKVNITDFCTDATNYLDEQSLNFMAKNADSAALCFVECLQNVIDKHAPLVNATVKPKKTPFTNDAIMTLRRKRRKAERSYRKYGTEEDAALFTSLTKDVKKLVKNTRNSYYKNELSQCKGNKKETFKVFNKLLYNENETKLPAYNDETELCKDFEKYFYNKISTIRDEINDDMPIDKPTRIIPLKQSTTSSFSDFNGLADDDVIKVFESLSNKHCGLDPVSTQLFKQCLGPLLPYVKHIINSSLKEGTFPACFKQALVKPKIKSQTLDSDDKKNFRPLSNISFLSKALERCVQNQFTKYLESNNMFSNFQSAYRKFHSCETAITKITNDLLCSIDNKQCSFLLFLDLSAAFDTVDHTILLSTLQTKYGVKGKALRWFKSYITNRSFKVNIGKSLSDGLCLLFGVPQGSILGPLLFILYIADIEHIAKCHGFKVHIYADDTQIYISFERSDIFSTISSVEHCLRDIKLWMLSNFLKINEDKTKLLLISSEQDLNSVYSDLCISFSGNIITPSLNAVNLGVTFDSTMSMTSYVNNIISKGYFKLNNFWRNADKLTYDLKLTLITTYILPLIDYCNISFTATSKLNVNKLQKLLNSAVRFVFNLTGRRYRFSITPYMKKLHILPVEYRIKYKVSLTVYKCFHDLAPEYLKELLQPKITYSHLRSSNDIYSLQTVIPNSKYGESSFSYIAPITWNCLPQSVQLAPSLECFKTRLKSHYFTECYGND